MHSKNERGSRTLAQVTRLVLTVSALCKCLVGDGPGVGADTKPGLVLWRHHPTGGASGPPVSPVGRIASVFVPPDRLIARSASASVRSWFRR